MNLRKDHYHAFNSGEGGTCFSLCHCRIIIQPVKASLLVGEGFHILFQLGGL